MIKICKSNALFGDIFTIANGCINYGYYLTIALL